MQKTPPVSTELLDQTNYYVDAKIFQQIVDWMDGPATPSEAAGMQRIPQVKMLWPDCPETDDNLDR